MSTEPILGGEAVVCRHAKKWINATRAELGLSEAETVERIINGYVHSWHFQYEVPLDSSYSSLARIIRNHANGGSDDE